MSDLIDKAALREQFAKMGVREEYVYLTIDAAQTISCAECDSYTVNALGYTRCLLRNKDMPDAHFGCSDFQRRQR
jgi:hypothetical protein